MLSLTVQEPNVKNFMVKLLKEDVFDTFETRSVLICTLARFEIDGARPLPVRSAASENIVNDRKPLESPEASGESWRKNTFCLWKEIRPFAFSFVKGASRPSLFKIVLSCAPERMMTLSNNASAMFLNIQLDGETVIMTTGVSPKNFVPGDRSHELAWDKYIQDFLNTSAILYVSNF